VHIQVYGSWFSVNERAFLPRWLHQGRLYRLNSGLAAELSPSRHDVRLAELNNNAVGVSVGIRRSAKLSA